MNLRDTLCIKDGELVIGGIKATDLAAQYSTPLYVLDVAHIRNILRAYIGTIGSNYGDGRVAYAGKALSIKAMYTVLKEENAYIDVVSKGEIFTAQSAGFDLSRAYFHGNNKLVDELEFAVLNGVGVIVIDNHEEIGIINTIAAQQNKVVNVSIRLNPGISAHTHAYIQTANVDSKFGFNITNGDALSAIKAIKECANLHFNGIHYHIGSQIFDTDAFRLAVNVGTDFMLTIKQELGIEVEELNLGGGFGVHYTEEDPKYTVDEYCNYVRVITDTLKHDLADKKLNKPRIVIEPGRSVVAEAGITLYSVGNIRVNGGVKYVCIDGGMGDNIRPALYQADYEAILANRAEEDCSETVTITGKCCESSDIIIRGQRLPSARRGDIVAVFSTGAYNYSMASNYNRNPIPAMVMVENGKSGYAVKPQTLEDIIRNDNIPDFLK